MTLYDTPGLSDIELVKKAGLELDSLLNEDVDIRICFVVTLEHGRPRPVDASTIDLILSAINVDVNNRFGVIINQVSKRVASVLETDVEAAAKVRNGLTGRFHTSHWHYVLKDPELEDCDDGMLMTNSLAFFLSSIPQTKPHDAAVETIDTDTLKEKQQQHEDRIKEIQDKHSSELQEMVDRFENEKEEAAQRLQDMRKEFSAMKDDYGDLKLKHDESERERADMDERMKGMQEDFDNVKMQQGEAEMRAKEMEVKYNELKNAPAGSSSSAVDAVTGIALGLLSGVPGLLVNFLTKK